MKKLFIAVPLILISFVFTQDKALGGPDAGGYTWIDSDEVDGPVYNWEDISIDGSPLNLTYDDVSTDLNLGFNFTFYGSDYTTVKVYSSGILSFNGPGSNTIEDEIPSSKFPYSMIAPMWFSYLDPGVSTAQVYYYADTANNRFIVQYDKVEEEGYPENVVTFQVILYADGRILFQYKDFQDAGFPIEEACIVGIQNQDASTGLEVVNYASYLKENFAIEFETTGTPYGGEISLSTTSINFGNVTISELAENTFSISNLSNIQLLKGNIITAITGYDTEEEINDTLAFEVDISSTDNFDLLFNPVADQSYSGYVVINSTDSTSTPDSIYVTGAGVYPNISLNSTDTIKTFSYIPSSATDAITVNNTGAGNLEFSTRVIAAKGSGGPDGGGYTWKDSDETDGPDYYWKDIRNSGTPLNLGDENHTGKLNLGISFPFYGTSFDSVMISSNGVLSFTSSGSFPTESNLPNSSEPNNTLAVFWNDLDPSAGGNIYSLYDDKLKRFIVQYNNIVKLGETATNTFQVLLYSDGTIVYQYKELNGTLDSTVGIENSDGTIGIEYNSMNLKNSLAVEFKPQHSGWLSVVPVRKVVSPSSSAALDITMSAAGLSAGTYTADIYIDSTDPDTPIITVPVEFTVSEIPAPALISPADSTLTTDLTPAFDWEDAADISSYNLLVDNNSDFSSPEINVNPVSSNYTPGSDMATGEYFWKVNAATADTSGTYSETRLIELGNLPDTPVLASPADSSDTTDLTPTFDWSDATGATSYRILVDNDSDFSSPVIDTSAADTTYTPASDMTADTYYWKVQGVNKFGSSSFTGDRMLRLRIIPDLPVNLVTSVSGTDLIIDWDDSSGATSYDVYYSDDPYGTFTYLTNVASSQYTYTGGESIKFFYIIAKNDTKESPGIIQVKEAVNSTK